MLPLVMEEHWSSANFVRESFKVKESSLHEIWHADTAFYLVGQIRTISLCQVKEDSTLNGPSTQKGQFPFLQYVVQYTMYLFFKKQIVVLRSNNEDLSFQVRHYLQHYTRKQDLTEVQFCIWAHWQVCCNIIYCCQKVIRINLYLTKVFFVIFCLLSMGHSDPLSRIRYKAPHTYELGSRG